MCNVQGVNRGFGGLLKEFCDKWLLKYVAPLNVDNGFAAAILSTTRLARLANHVDNVKDLLSNYIGRNNDGQLKAFV